MTALSPVAVAAVNDARQAGYGYLALPIMYFANANPASKNFTLDEFMNAFFEADLPEYLVA